MNYEMITYDKEVVLGLAKYITKQPTTLLEGKPYTPSASTDIRKTFAKLGWVPPSEVRK